MPRKYSNSEINYTSQLPLSKLLLPLLSLAVAFAALATDMVIPVLRAIKNDFGVSNMEAQLIIGGFIGGFGIGQLFIGSLSDRFGRRIVLLTGMFFFTIVSVLCGIAEQIETIISLRILQGIAASSGMVVARAIIRDIYRKKAMVKALASMLAMVSVIPLIVPFLGAYFSEYTHWSWSFYFMAAVGCLCFIFCYKIIPETLPIKKRMSLHPLQILKNYRDILCDRHAVGYGLAQCFFFGGMFVNISNSPFIVMGFLNHSLLEFSFYFAAITGGIIIGGILSRILIEKYNVAKVKFIGLWIISTASLFLAGFALLEVWNIFALMFPMIFYTVGYGMLQPCCMTKSMDHFPHIAGTVSALFGAIQFGLASLIGITVTAYLGDTSLNFTLFIAGCTALGVITIKFINDE
jgi:DHA1 family bicyclomycin/chloramphenicol resistance-like MFS transporter